MNYKEFLYDKDKVLSFYPELAVIFNKYDDMEIERIKREEEEAEEKGIVLEKKEKRPDKNGLGKAIVVNQLNYWLNLNEKTHHNYKDGYYWLYFSYSNWIKEDFKFWSVKTLQRILTSLENCGVVVSTSEYNKWKIDNTKWYRINYERLQEIIDIVYENERTSGQLVQTVETDCPYSQVNLTRPLPEITNIDYNTENTIISPTELNSFSKEKAPSPVGLNSSISKRNKKGGAETDKWIATKTHIEVCMERYDYEKDSLETIEVIEIVKAYYEKYKEMVGKPHPRLNDKVMMFVVGQCLKEVCGEVLDVQTYRDLIDFHFKTEYREGTDWTIQHFMSGDIRETLLRHNML